MTALAVVHKDSILQQIAKGRLIKHIAADLGISHAAISQQLAQDPDYRAARETGAEARLETEYEKLESAQDQLTLARARETFRAASWFAEREFPSRWGAKHEVPQVAVQVNITHSSE